MSFLRRTVLASVIFSLVLLTTLAGIFGILSLRYSLLETKETLIIALLFLFLSTLITFFYSFHLPLRKITREMTSLLTGKAYQRILTNKSNELGILAHFFNEVTRNLESISMDVQTHKRIQKELNAAQEIQELLIPKTAPQILGLEITAKTRPASELGGDTFDFFNKQERTILYIGDSTGHGIPAGIVMVMVDALLETFIHIEESLPNMLIKLNQFLKPHLKPSMFMTMALLEWVAAEKKLKWVGAGHEYILHVKTEAGTVEVIKTGGLAVGMLPDNRAFVKEQELILNENDFVVLYSDGIVEAKNIRGEIYGLPRLQSFLQAHATSSITTEELFGKIASDVGRFMEGQSQLDDMTLIVMKHSLKKVETIETSTSWTSPSEETSAKSLAPSNSEPV